MNKIINFSIDGKDCIAEKGQYILEAARDNGIYIPSLCNIQGLKPRGACRVCNVRVNGKLMTACTTPVTEGMKVENNTTELQDLRKAIIEIMFVEGNHLCPACEKSGSCDLQALAYRYQMMVPRFPYQFPHRDVETTFNLVKDHNRCILCKRCIRAIKDDDGRSIFAFKRRGHKAVINIDTRLSRKMTDDLARQAMDICPVGALLKKGKGFDTPIGHRKYDLRSIGSEVEDV
ncbi:MAG: 2Fe-2S iron-sulfur cluster-binding protein [Candidatus Cyclobacteriaceae bacterium M3_2C_046]